MLGCFHSVKQIKELLCRVFVDGKKSSKAFWDYIALSKHSSANVQVDFLYSRDKTQRKTLFNEGFCEVVDSVWISIKEARVVMEFRKRIKKNWAFLVTFESGNEFTVQAKVFSKFWTYCLNAESQRTNVNYQITQKAFAFKHEVLTSCIHSFCSLSICSPLLELLLRFILSFSFFPVVVIYMENASVHISTWN